MSNEYTEKLQPALRDLDFAEASDVLRALSNPNRLRIFVLVRDASVPTPEGDGLKVGEIAEAMEISQSTVSHHLREIEHARLVNLERRGKNVFCRASCRQLGDIIEFLSCEGMPA